MTIMTSMATSVRAAAAAQPVTPATAAALQFQWTQLPAQDSAAAADASEFKYQQRLSVTPVDDDGNDLEEDEEEEEEQHLHQQQQQPVEPKQPAWQAATDLPDRRVMVQRILSLTERRRQPGAVEPSRRRTANAPASDSATALAKRIELSLYSRAGSLDEYRNTATLRRRLQSLVSLSFHEAAAAKDAASGLLVRRKRCRPAAVSPSQLMSKRRRVSTSSGLLGPLSEDSLRTVFSFLDGRQVLRLRCLSRFARAFLPSTVRSLHVDIRQLHQHFALDVDYTTFRSLTSLEQLTVFKTADPCAVPTASDQKLALHAWGCHELDVSHSNAGEAVMQHLALALERGAGRKLRGLQLVSTFSNTSQRNGLRALCQALARGACPRLRDLLLGGNSISDAGAADVARLLESKALPQLTRLDLRRNYIGECGLRRLMAALSAAAPLTQLKYLCLGGNLVTDQCVAALTGVLAQGACPQMRFLGLEDNFLSPDGVQTIIQAAVAGGMAPKLHRVASDGVILAAVE